MIRSSITKTRFYFASASVAFIMVTGFVLAQSDNSNDDPARDLVVSVTERIFTRFSENSEQILASDKFAKQFIETELLPVLDIERFGRIILAANWKKATPEQRDRFIFVLQEFLINSFAEAMTGVAESSFDYKTQIQILDSTKGRNENNVSVKMLIALDDQNTRSVEFRVGRKETGEWKVYDVVFEGVSFAINYRAILKSAIRKSGLDEVIEDLAQKLEPST